MGKSKLESEGISVVLRNKTVEKREKFAHTRTLERIDKENLPPYLGDVLAQIIRKINEVVDHLNTEKKEVTME